jgi:hypothetical protein
MDTLLICQSCTMPIDNVDDRGTEKDGSKSNEYCKFCYREGLFTDPGLTLEQMKAEIGVQMKKHSLPVNVLEKSLAALPSLKRWKQQAGLNHSD